jgi:hypothetical protein
LPASVLAAEAGVAPSTASPHLARLLDAGLLTVRPQGRHRYYALAGPHVGELIEALARLAPCAPVRSLRDGTRAHALRRARTCYDHLAGRLGIVLTDALTSRGLLRQDTGFALTDAGLHWFDAAGIGLDRTSRRPLARACLDWTERRPHLAGTAGAARCRHALDARAYASARRGGQSHRRGRTGLHRSPRGRGRGAALT